MSWWNVAGGGGDSASEAVTLRGTVGQPGASLTSGGSVSIYGGFWPALRQGQAPPLPSLIAWTNWHGGKFSVAANWNPSRIPGPSDTAVFGTLRSSYTVTVDADQSVASLTLGPGATLAGTNLLSVLGALTWTGGKITGRVLCNGGTVSGADTHTLSAGQLVNGGVLQLTATITTAGAAVLTNLPGAALELAADVGIAYSSGGYGAIINQGTFRKSGGAGLSAVSEVITNTGAIESRSGTLLLSRPFVQTDGATFVLEGQLRLAQGMLLAGGRLTGTNRINGSVTNSGGVLAPGLAAGGLTISGRYVQTSGGTLAIDIAGPHPGSDCDVVTVLGVAKLAGTLNVNFLDRFAPPAGTSFEFLAAASVGGVFAGFDPPLDGLGLTIFYAPDHVALSQGGLPPRFVRQYALVDLGGLTTTGCSPQAINNRGQVVGSSSVSGGSHAFLYDQGVMHDLGTLAGTMSYAAGINDAGHVVGWSTVTAASAPSHAFYYDGTMHDLGTLGAPSHSSRAYGINNNDEIIGYSDLTVYGGSSTHPFLAYGGTMIDLHSPFLPGNTNAGAFAYGLNDRLQIVGYAPRPVGAGHGFRYDYVGGAVLDVGDLGGANGSVAQAVNRAGEVTGWAYTDNNLWVHAYRFDGRIHDLGTLGGRNSHGFAVNASGQIVGRAEYEGANAAPHAFLYSGREMIDLNTVLPPNSGWDLREATGINDQGQIVGNAYWHGVGRGFLLTPLPSLQLQIPPDGGLIVIRGLEFQGYILQENPELTPAGWVEVNATPTVVGHEVRVILPRPTGTRFYRLRQP